MRRFIEVLTFLLALLAGAFVSALACSSTPAPAHSPATRAQLASVVLLVERVAAWQEPALSADGFADHTGSYSSVWRGRCSAFALERMPGGDIYLVTAAHCVKPLTLGAFARYLPPDGWGVDRAAIVKLDRVRDYAELSPERNGGLVALQHGPAPDSGAPVLSVSAFFEEQAPGLSKGALSGAWYGTTQRIEHGWSGSPVLDSSGRAWGFLAKCQTYKGKCTTGAIVGAL